MNNTTRRARTVGRGDSESSYASSYASSQDSTYKCDSTSGDDDDDQSSELIYDFPRRKNKYECLINMVLDIFTLIHEKKYYITEPDIKDTNTYIFRIKLRDEFESVPHVSYVVIRIMEDEVNSSSTKSGKPVLTWVFNIASVSTNVNHSGKHLAILLLIYAISYLKFKYKPIKYAILDDCSNQSTDMKNNIYHQLGFVPREDTSVDFDFGKSKYRTPDSTDSQASEPSHIVLASGPEKIANLDEFPQKAIAKLNNIIKKYEIAESDLMRDLREQNNLDDLRRDDPIRRNPRRDDRRGRERNGGKKFTKKSYKRKSYKRKSYKRKSYKRKSYKRK